MAMAGLGKAGSPVISVLLWCVIAMGICSFNGPFWAVPSGFLAGIASASGIALINSVGNLGGFVGPFALGWIGQRIGSLYTGLAFAGASLVVSALLMVGTGVGEQKRKVTVA